MSYSTVPDVRAALSPDADPRDEDTPSSYSDEQLADCIARADTQIDLYLRATYATPVAEPDELLKDWSSAIAAYLAVLVQAGGNNIEKTDPIQLRYDRALADLVGVSKGDLILPYPGNEVTGAGDPVVINKPGQENLFTGDEFYDVYNPHNPSAAGTFTRGPYYSPYGDWNRDC